MSEKGARGGLEGGGGGKGAGRGGGGPRLAEGCGKGTKIQNALGNNRVTIKE